jgi:hypothetical protein
MRPLFSIWFVAAMLLTAAHLHADSLALEPGERFTYRLSWGIFGKAAELTVEATEEPNFESQRTRITSRTATKGLIRALYPFDGQADLVYDNASGRLIEASATTKARSDKTSATIVLDYNVGIATYTNHLDDSKSLTVPIPAGSPADFITTLIQTRTWDINLGEKRHVSVLFDDEFYDLVITAESEQVISTKWGKKNTLMLVPRMEENPKGMFRKGGEVRVWVSRDADRLPLRFEVKTKVGIAMAILTGYEANSPAGATAQPDASAPDA